MHHRAKSQVLVRLAASDSAIETARDVFIWVDIVSILPFVFDVSASLAGKVRRCTTHVLLSLRPTNPQARLTLPLTLAIPSLVM